MVILLHFSGGGVLHSIHRFQQVVLLFAVGRSVRIQLPYLTGRNLDLYREDSVTHLSMLVAYLCTV